MAGFFPHTGGTAQSYQALPLSSFASLLNDIVGDVATGGLPGVNGWTLYDDQRAGGGEIVAAPYGGIATKDTSYDGTIWTNNSQALTWENNNYGHFGFYCQPGLTPVSPDKVDWYTITGFTNHQNVTIDRNYVGTTKTVTPSYTKLGGYIILKCQSEQKIFYVKLSRTMDYQSTLRVQTFETWNAITHTGSGGGPEELMRAYDWPSLARSGASTKLQYILWLLPDAMALWCGADPAESGIVGPGLSTAAFTLWDLFYVGNLIPSRIGDAHCVIQACSNQNLSGCGAYVDQSWGSALGMNGGASCMRSLAGLPWWNPPAREQASYHAMYALYPRGMTFLQQLDRTPLNEAGKFEFCPFDAFHTGLSIHGVNGRTWEGRRGELRYLKACISNPIGLNLVSFGPSDDGNTYVCIRVSRPTNGNREYPSEFGFSYLSGFARGARYGIAGDIEVNSGENTTWNERYFLLPTNI